jgi:hypothetical protein
MRRAWLSVLIISLIQILIPILVGIAFKQIILSVTSNSFSFNIQFSGISSGFVSLLSFIIVNPLLAIISALLYLKTRQAGGESLSETLESLSAEELPQSKWQALMRGQRNPLPTAEGIKEQST